MDKTNNQQKIKIILLGEACVGKTSLINAYFGKIFNNNIEATISSESKTKIIKINEIAYEIHVWDTAGSERFRSVSKIFIKNSNIVILVYDITNKRSFSELSFWAKYVEELLGKDIILGVVGNKMDLFQEISEDQIVSKEEGEKYANEIGALFCETSAKEDAKGFESFVQKLINDFISKGKGLKIDEELDLLKPEKKKKKCC